MTRILLTRPEAGDDPLARALRALGYEVEAVPAVAREPLEFSPPDLEAFDWVVVTSAAGVAALAEIRRPPRWAAVGPATAAALRARGAEVDFLPSESNGEALARELPDVVGRCVLVARADAAAEDLPAILRARGADVTELALYRTVVAPPASRRPLLTALARGLHATVFASPSAVAGYVGLGGDLDVLAVTIGPRTSAAARRAGFPRVAEAAAATPAALAALVAQALPAVGR